MLSVITLKNFRGFKKLKMPGLARVNLITGKNNTGKTALLEGIYLSCQQSVDADVFHQLFRNAPGQSHSVRDFWHWLLHNERSSQEADIQCEWSDGTTSAIYIRRGSGQRGPYDAALVHAGDMSVFWTRGQGEQKPRPASRVLSFSTRPTPPTLDAALYASAAKKSGGEEKIEALLREIEPRLKRVRAYQIEGSQHSLVYADIGLHELIPVTQLGQGFNRLLNLYSAMLATGSQICLIDEVENGLHHSVLRDAWKGLAALAHQENVQIFATTHSWECAVAAHEVFREREPYGFALHRLERINGEVDALTYDRETLDAVDELEMEVR